MDSILLRIDRTDVMQSDDQLTLILGAAGVHVMLIRLRYDGCGIRQVRAALLEILDCACFVADTAEGRITS